MYLSVNTLLQGGKYKIVRFISSGGFGCTYEAEHVMLEKRVAIKEFFVKDFCNRDESTAHVTVGTLSKKGLVDKLRRKFIDEAKALCRLQHSGIVSVQDVFEENGTAYFVMDYVDGKSLSEIVKEQGPLPEERVVRYIRQVATALQYVHDNNRLHLDIKPGNIMIDGNDNPVLIDFGASKQYDEEDGENTSTLMGKTPGYAPPEQMSNSVVKFLPATDIYALGATLYKLLTGITPLDVNLRISGEELKPLPTNISAATRNAITAAMEINKNKRPQTVAAFIELLKAQPTSAEETIYDAEESSAPKVAAVSKPNEYTSKQSGRESKSYIGIIVGIIIVAILVAGAYWGINQWQETQRRKQLQIEAEERERIAEETRQRELEEESLRLADEKRKKEEAQRERLSKIQSISIPIGKSTQSPAIDMIKVDGGTYTRGVNTRDGSGVYDDVKPAHQINVSSFYISKYEITQEQWMTIMESNPSCFKGESLPIDNISWNDAQVFISRLNAKTGKKFRLPTEAEWEFAARGGIYHSGYTYSGGNNVADVAWYSDNSGRETHPIGEKVPNELGIYDMSGNILEWCNDWYDRDYYRYCQATNPQGPDHGYWRVLRGGSWTHIGIACSVSKRYSDNPDTKKSCYGLRLAMDVK